MQAGRKKGKIQSPPINEIDRIGPPRVDRATVCRPLSLTRLLCDGESHCRLTATADASTLPSSSSSLFVRHDRLGTTALLSPHWTLFGGIMTEFPIYVSAATTTPSFPTGRPRPPLSLLPPSLCSPLPPRKRALRAAFYEIVNLSSGRASERAGKRNENSSQKPISGDLEENEDLCSRLRSV